LHPEHVLDYNSVEPRSFVPAAVTRVLDCGTQVIA
jgi:hypothetical protein